MELLVVGFVIGKMGVVDFGLLVSVEINNLVFSSVVDRVVLSVFESNGGDS